MYYTYSACAEHTKFQTEKVEETIWEDIYLCMWDGYTGSSKKMDGIWNRYNLKSTGRIYMFGILKCPEKFKFLDFP
jgi:hypothetical protein